MVGDASQLNAFEREQVLREVLELEDRVLRTGGTEAAELLVRAAELRLRGLGQDDAALALLRRALHIREDFRPALNRYTRLCAQLERWIELADGLELAARAARDDDERAKVLAHRGDVLGKRLGRLAEARSTYREVARLSRDPELKRAAVEAVERLEQLMTGQRIGGPVRPAAARERTLVQLRSQLPEPPRAPKRATAAERAEELFTKAAQALEARQLTDARAWTEQGLAIEAWHPSGLRLRRELLRAEGRFQELLRLLLAESEEAPVPAVAQGALREAARLLGELGDFDGALVMFRRALMLPGAEEETIAEAVALSVAQRRLDAAKRLLPDLAAAARAKRLEQLASAAQAAGDHRAALEHRALAFDDRPDEVAFFQARIQVQSAQGDEAGVEATLRRRLEVVVDPDERQATLWELAAASESQGRWRDAVAPLIESITAAVTPADVEQALEAVQRLARLAHDPTLLARAYEAAAFRRQARDGDRAGWLVRLARLRRDELCDLEGAEAAFRAAISSGARVAAELELLEDRLSTVERRLPEADPSDSSPLVVPVRDEAGTGPTEAGMLEILPSLDPPGGSAELLLAAVGLLEPAAGVQERAALPAEDPADGAAAPPERVLSMLREGRLDEALAVLAGHVTSGSPAPAAVWITAACAAADAGRDDEALACADRGLDAARDEDCEAVAAALWAEALDRAGDARGAAAARVAMVGTLGEAARAAQCERLAEELDAEPWLEMAWLEAALEADPGRVSAAHHLLSRAPERAPELAASVVPGADPAALLRWLERLAEVLAAAGEVAAAVSVLERALAVPGVERRPAAALAALAGRDGEGAPRWLDGALAALRDRAAWAGVLVEAVQASRARIEAGVADAADRLLVQAGPALPESPSAVSQRDATAPA